MRARAGGRVGGAGAALLGVQCGGCCVCGVPISRVVRSAPAPQRGPTFVFCAQLRTKSAPIARWVLAGVCLLMDVVPL